MYVRQPRRYLMVVPVRAFTIDEQRAAMESAFCEHLRELLARLAPSFDEMTVATVGMPQADFEANEAHLGVLDAQRDRIRVVPLYPGELGTVDFARALPEVLRRLRGLVREHALVHSGPSHDLRRPIEIASLAMGVREGRPTISVTDIDLRSDAEMNRKLGRWSLKSYLLCRFLYDPVRDLEHHWIARRCSLVLFKSEAQRADYGTDRPNVRTFQDVAFQAQHLIAPDALEEKIAAVRDPRRPLEAVYFGRLVAYKGVDRCLDAVASARARGRDVRLTVIGTGDEEPRLREKARGLEEVVRFQGAVPYGAPLFDQVRARHLMLATPLSNDTPRSTWDAMASGVPVLAFGTDYYRDLEASTGAVETVPWPSTEALADRLTHYADHREELAERMRAAVEVAKENTSEAWLQRRVAWTRALMRPQAGAA
ncbi:MAG: glycosyltransferase [Sandaracinaceae bacterium]